MTQQPVVEQVAKENSVKPGTWIVDGDLDSMASNNLLTVIGVTVANTLSVVPKFETWQKLNPTHKYGKIYNGYIGINVKIRKKNKKSRLFRFEADDFFILYPDALQLQKSGVSYILSTQKLGKMDTKVFIFQPVGNQINGRQIHHLERR